MRVVRGLLLIAAASLCACAASRSAERAQSDALVAAQAQAVEPAPSNESTHATSARAERSLPDGAVKIELRHADARDVARMLNELDEASFWKMHSRGCVLYKGPEVLTWPTASDEEREDAAKWDALLREGRWIEVDLASQADEWQIEALREYLRGGSRVRPLFRIEPPPPSFREWDERTLVVLEASRDDEYLPRVRELVARLDQPEPPLTTR